MKLSESTKWMIEIAVAAILLLIMAWMLSKAG
jgi:hypothetical protein